MDDIDEREPHPLDDQLASAIADALIGQPLAGAHTRIAQTVIDLLIAEGIVPADYWEYGNRARNVDEVDPAFSIEQAESFLHFAPEYVDISRRRRASQPGPWESIRS